MGVDVITVQVSDEYHTSGFSVRSHLINVVVIVD